jgi:hypothetical protein
MITVSFIISNYAINVCLWELSEPHIIGIILYTMIQVTNIHLDLIIYDFVNLVMVANTIQGGKTFL